MDSENTPKQQKRSYKYRLLAVVLLFAGLFFVGRAAGLADWDAQSIRLQVEEAGFLGFGLYIVVFAGGEFIHIPGMIFVAAAILAYGKVVGFALAFVASVISVCFSFAVVRAVGGKALTRIERPFFKRILAKLDKNPIRVVAILRLFLWLAPALNYSLALTNLKFRDYLVGSALGLIVPVAGATLFFDWAFGRLF